MTWTAPKTWAIGDVLTAADMNTYVRDNTGDLNARLGYQNISYSASITPDPFVGATVFVGTLTGNITVNNPSQGVTGTVIRFVFTQDGTGGRTITWGAAYKTKSNPLHFAANQTFSVEFVYNGTDWIQTNSSVNNVSAPTAASITVSASPFTYRNVDGWDQMVVLSGGSVSKLEWSRDNSTFYDVGTTQTYSVSPGEYLRVTYSSVPTMTKVPR